jgi:hypothetical protein
MNTEFKNFVQSAIDVYAVAKGLVKKTALPLLFPAIYKVVMDAAADISGITDIQAEIAALKANPAAIADLVAYIAANVAGVTDDAHAQKVLDAVLDLVGTSAPKVIALEQAIAGS